MVMEWLLILFFCKACFRLNDLTEYQTQVSIQSSG